jgi:hypothetical protein
VPPLTLLPAAALTVLGLALAIGCGNRVIELDVPDAGTTPPAANQCEPVKRADGTVCTICFLADGSTINRGCETPPPPPVPGTGGAAAECKVIPKDDLRCLACTSATGTYSPCLTCDSLRSEKLQGQ